MNIKTLFFVLAALCLKNGHSQIDLSFENWNTNAGYIQPNGWITNNWAVQCVFPDSSATNGSYAARIENNVIGFAGRGTGVIIGRFSNLTGLIDSITFDISIDSIYFGGYARVGASLFYNGVAVINTGYNIDTTSNGYFKICLNTMDSNVSEIDSLWLGFSSRPQTLPNGDLDGFCRFKVDNVQFFYSSLSDDIKPKERNQLEFFPNPATDKSIQVSTDVIKIRISDMEGNEVYNELVSNRTIELSSLSSGVYMILLEGEDHFKREKLIIK
jgi:hypothetical protein